MKYCDLREAFRAYDEGENVTEVLKGTLGERSNTDEIIEIAYDLQAGTYINNVTQNSKSWRNYTSELADIISIYTSPGDTLLDAGAGELTTLAGVADRLSIENITYSACDISWSRIKKGKEFIGRGLKQLTLNAFVANFFHLPLRDKSIDVLFTSHALEPNGGREEQILAELIRVTRRKIILFEPSMSNSVDDVTSNVIFK